MIFSSNPAVADRILPLPKPKVDQETKDKTAKKKEIYPKKKPKVKKEIQKSESEEKSLVKEDVKKETFIYPERKPVIFKKTIDKTVERSLIFNFLKCDNINLRLIDNL